MFSTQTISLGTLFDVALRLNEHLDKAQVAAMEKTAGLVRLGLLSEPTPSSSTFNPDSFRWVADTIGKQMETWGTGEWRDAARLLGFYADALVLTLNMELQAAAPKPRKRPGPKPKASRTSATPPGLLSSPSGSPGRPRKWSPTMYSILVQAVEAKRHALEDLRGVPVTDKECIEALVEAHEVQPRKRRATVQKLQKLISRARQRTGQPRRRRRRGI